MQAPENRREREPIHSRICIFIILTFLITTIAGCVSMEEFERGVSPPTPTPVQQESEPAEIPMETTTSEIAPSGQPVTGGYVKKPFGYLWFEDRISPPVTIIEVKAETDNSGQKYIAGRIRNEGTERIGHLTVVYNLYDANGNVLGNACASIDYLGAGKTWKFSTDPFEQGDYQFFELAEIFAV